MKIHLPSAKEWNSYRKETGLPYKTLSRASFWDALEYSAFLGGRLPTFEEAPLGAWTSTLNKRRPALVKTRTGGLFGVHHIHKDETAVVVVVLAEITTPEGPSLSAPKKKATIMSDRKRKKNEAKKLQKQEAQAKRLKKATKKAAKNAAEEIKEVAMVAIQKKETKAKRKAAVRAEEEALLCPSIKKARKAFEAKRNRIFKKITPIHSPGFSVAWKTPIPKKKEVSIENCKDQSRFSKALYESQERLTDGRLTWNPGGELVELYKEFKVMLNKYDRPILPSIGGESDVEVIPGLPMWAMINESGEVDFNLAPTSAIEANPESTETVKEVLIKGIANLIRKAIQEGTTIPFLAAKKLWNGPAHIFDVFGDDGARISASLGSTNAKGLYRTDEQGVEAYVVNLSDPKSLRALADERPDVFTDIDRMCLWTGTNASVIGDVDGMSFAGIAAMPGKTQACQMRILGVQDKKTIEFYKNCNESFGDSIAKDYHPKMDDNELTLAYDKAVIHCLAQVEERLSVPKVRYAKGMLVETPWVRDNVLLIDVNALKGRDKETIQAVVQSNGWTMANKLIVGLLQDIGTGSISMSWQAIIYFLWAMPENFPAEYKGTKMDGRPGFGPAQTRGMEKIEKSIDEFGKGILDDTMSKIFSMMLDDDQKRGEKTTEKLVLAMWNNVVIRNEVSSWVMNFLRKNKYLFQTVAMEKINTILPEKRYVFDMNWLPDHTQRIPIKLHDGTVHQACTVFLEDQNFWKHLGVDKIPVVMFKHPISDFRVVDVVILANPRAYGWKDLAPGVWMHSSVMKEVFVGDTDGDVVGYFPLWTPLSGTEDGSLTCDWGAEDYCCFYAVVKAAAELGESSTNVEEYVKDVKKAKIMPYLGAAEEVMSESGKLVGQAALLQSQIIRLHDHFLNGKLVVRNPENQKDLETMIQTIIAPLRKEISAILELSINLQKKDVRKNICQAMENATFGTENVDDEYFRRLIMAMIVASTDEDDKKKISKAIAIVQSGVIKKFPTNWGTSVAHLLRNLLEEMDAGILQADGSIFSIVYASDSTSGRFADQMKDDDPELCFGTHQDMNWGILPQSNMVDCLAFWTDGFNQLASRVKEKVLLLTTQPKLKGNYKEITNANRCVHNTQWRHIVTNRDLSEYEARLLGDLYSSKIMWTGLNLPLRFKEQKREGVKFPQMKDMFKHGMMTDSPTTALIGNLVVRLLLEDTDVVFPEFARLVRGLFSEAHKREGSISSSKVNARANDWMSAFMHNLSEHKTKTNFEWILCHMTEDTQRDFILAIRDMAKLVLSAGALDLKDIKKLKNYLFTITKNNKLHKEAPNLLALLLPIYYRWAPTENEYRELFAFNKKARKAMKEEKKIWRDKTNALLEECTGDLLLQCWTVAHEKNTMLEILSIRPKSGKRGSWISKGEYDFIQSRDHLQYFFGAWGFDAMREADLTMSNTVGKPTDHDNPRMPILINEDLWEKKGMNLHPVAVCIKPEEAIHWRGQSSTRNMHATQLLNDEDELVAIACESLNIMRILLAYETTSIYKGGLETSTGLDEAECKPGAAFEPISDWWRKQYPGTWTRAKVKLRCFSKSQASVLSEALSGAFKVLDGDYSEIPEIESAHRASRNITSRRVGKKTKLLKKTDDVESLLFELEGLFSL